MKEKIAWWTSASGALFGFALAVTTLPNSAHATELPGFFTGGTINARASAKLKPLAVRLAALGGKTLACDGTNGRTRRGEVAGVSIDNVVSADLFKTTVFSEKSATRATARTRVVVTNLNLLNGLITADLAESVANVHATRRRIKVDWDGTTFSNLVIGGTPISAEVARNTTIALPGVGSVTIKHVRSRRDRVTKAQASIAVELLRIRVTESNALALPVGLVIVVGRSAVGYDRGGLPKVVAGVGVIGRANASAGTVGPKLARLASVHVPCQGTDGETVVKTTLGLAEPNIVSLGVGETTAFGGFNDSGQIEVKTTALINNVSLLGGLVQVDAVEAVARDRLIYGNRVSSTDGTRVVGLRVAGIPMGNITTPNFVVNVPLVGQLILNEQVLPDPTTRQRTTATGLRLVVSLGGSVLPVGAEISLGQAKSMIDGTPAGATAAAVHIDDAEFEWGPAEEGGSS